MVWMSFAYQIFLNQWIIFYYIASNFNDKGNLVHKTSTRNSSNYKQQRNNDAMLFSNKNSYPQNSKSEQRKQKFRVFLDRRHFSSIAFLEIVFDFQQKFWYQIDFRLYLLESHIDPS